MNRYKIYLKEVAEDVSPTLEFEFENHDNLFFIIEKMKASNIFDDDLDAEKFALGLKLFSSVMMKHRNKDVFSNFEPAFITFMKNLKSKL